MRDVIWTVIAIWVIYKLVDIFRASGSKKAPAYQDTTIPKKEVKKDVRTAINKGADKEGEYVDYEDVK
jgi:hypothetical protein